MNFNYSDPFIKKIVYWILPLADYLKTSFFKNNVLIHGSYYTTNIGDRAIAVVLKNELRRRGYRSTIVSHFFSSPHQQNIVVGGGGVIHNLYDHNLELRTNVVKNNNNVIYIGVGCPGFNDLTSADRRNISKLKMAKYISVRDLYSQEIMNIHADVKTEILACPAWLIDRNLDTSDFSIRNIIFRAYYNCYYRTSNHTKQKSNTIGVILNGHYNLMHLDKIKRMLKELSITNSLIFIPFVGEDLEFFKAELADLDISCNKLKGPIETYNTVLKMDRIIATRYHSLIFSILAKKPVMILAYSQKVISLAEDLKLKYYNLTLDAAGTFEFNNSINQSLVQFKVEQAETQIVRIISNLV